MAGMLDLPIHPACALWPRPSDEDVKALAADIKANGLLNPIWLFEGAVLDGKTRYEACEIAGVEPRFETYTGDDPVKFTISQNRLRRQLAIGELSLIVAELCKLPQNPGRNQYTTSKGLARPHLQSADKTAEELAKEAGIGRTAVVAAKTVLHNGEPNIINMVRANKVGAQSAAAFVKKTPRLKQRDATVEEVKQGRTLRDSVRRNKYGVPVTGKRNIPVTIPSKKTLEERKKPQPMITIPARDVTEKFRSLIKQVKEQSKKHPATVSFGALAVIAFELEQLADSWTENRPENGTHSEPVPLQRS